MNISKEFILHEITKVTKYIIKNDNIVIVCPFHDDREPSLSISLGGKVSPGVFGCWACKSSGHWNTLANKLGLRKVEDFKNEGNYYYVNDVKVELFKPLAEESLTLSKWDLKWKRYKPSFLKQFGAKKLWHDIYADNYLYLPLTYLNDRLGFVRAKIDKDSIGPKYWYNVDKKVLYPVDYLLNFDTPVIVLTEGLADSLRLIKNKIPSLSLLGTNLTNLGKEILEGLGVETIILCLDGDQAGKNAMFGYHNKSGKFIIGLVQVLDKLGYNVRFLSLPQDEDPDSVDYKYIKLLKHMVLENEGKLL